MRELPLEADETMTLDGWSPIAAAPSGIARSGLNLGPPGKGEADTRGKIDAVQVFAGSAARPYIHWRAGARRHGRGRVARAAFRRSAAAVQVRRVGGLGGQPLSSLCRTV